MEDTEPEQEQSAGGGKNGKEPEVPGVSIGGGLPAALSTGEEGGGV